MPATASSWSARMASLISFTRVSRVFVGSEGAVRGSSGQFGAAMLPISNRYGQSGSVACRSGFDELHQDAAGVLRVHEVDPAVGGGALGGGVDQPQTPFAEGRAHRLDVLDPEGQLLQTRSGAADELRDRRLGRQRGQQLDAGRAVGD